MNDLIQCPDDDAKATEDAAAGDGEQSGAAGAVADEATCSKKVYDELLDRHARLQADFDNFRKRLDRERKHYQETAVEHLVIDILPVLDNLDLALRHARGDGANETIVAGIDMVHRQFLGVMDRHGLKRIAAVGLPFDPNYHEAIARVEDDSLPDGTVAEEFQGGYLLGTKVIRPSRVSVSQRRGDVPSEATEGAE